MLYLVLVFLPEIISNNSKSNKLNFKLLENNLQNVCNYHAKEQVNKEEHTKQRFRAAAK